MTGPGRARVVLLAALALYLSLDFANPHMPGALTFDPDQSVEALRAARAPHLLVAPASTPPAVRPVLVAARPFEPRRAAEPAPVVEWRAPRAHTDRRPADRPAPADDH